MARSFSSVKLLSSFVVDGVSNAFVRRGYAAAAQGAVSSSARTSGSRSGVRGLRKAGDDAAASTYKVSWGPDPKTGYYRPENGAAEVDVAELRAALLKHSS